MEEEFARTDTAENMSDDEMEATAGEADPDHLGSAAEGSGLTAGGTDTSIPGEAPGGGGYGGSTTGGSSSGTIGGSSAPGTG